MFKNRNVISKGSSGGGVEVPKALALRNPAATATRTPTRQELVDFNQVHNCMIRVVPQRVTPKVHLLDRSRRPSQYQKSSFLYRATTHHAIIFQSSLHTVGNTYEGRPIRGIGQISYTRTRCRDIKKTAFDIPDSTKNH